MDINNLSSVEKQKLAEIADDPVKWAQVFVRIFDRNKGEYVPWVARWYQVNMLRDGSIRKVARCGRRTGKTETMCIDMLHRTNKNTNYRCVVATPYETQVRLIFARLREITDSSPLLKNEIKRFTSSPFIIEWKNGSSIYGFTTGAASGSGGASIRGQRADYIYMDEVDYMQNADFDTVMTIAAERNDIGIFMSSTPTGARAKFYQCCTDKSMGFSEHHYPSMANPDWDDDMEAQFRAQLSDQGYVHEVLAEFGTQDTGVFDKSKLDASTQYKLYHYDELTTEQSRRLKESKLVSESYIYGGKAPSNPFRTMGVDWDKYGASSSIIILDFDVNRQKFIVIKRIEVPRAEYSYDKAIQMVVELNDKYNPSWIFVDRGNAEYQLERLHIIGDKRPSTGLKNKVVGWQFSETVEIINPITREVSKEPMKPFMVNQLQIVFERDRMILSPFDEVLYKQLIDYEVLRVSKQNRMPIFSNKDEHFVDALGLAYLAFVLNFPELAGTIEDIKASSKVETVSVGLGQRRVDAMFSNANDAFKNATPTHLGQHSGDLKGDRPTWKPVSHNSSSRRHPSWGGRNVKGGISRSLW